MRKRNLVVVGVASLAGLAAGAIFEFRRNPRFGVSFVNAVVNPALISRRLAGSGRAEIATLEHIGRRSGQRRLTLVHPQATPGGFRILVPLGQQSEWARNVIAAGHCRLQLHDVVFELDEPAMVRPTRLDGLPRLVRRFEDYLGFEYITLRRFDSAPGYLETVDEAKVRVPIIDDDSIVRREGTRLLEGAPV